MIVTVVAMIGSQRESVKKIIITTTVIVVVTIGNLRKRKSKKCAAFIMWIISQGPQWLGAF
ncbi:hypothetical protein [Filobacillus milosensis]|nr:hypothetical protein [Filobacillus milosensis]